MHMRTDGTGMIVHLGPTARKVFPHSLGRHLLDLFECLRPASATDMPGLRTLSKRRLRLRHRQSGETFRGVLAPLPDGGLILKLAFGIQLVEDIRSHGLTSADFEPTDLTVEMLYLLEAKTAAMDASRSLNQRLQVARISAETQAFTDTLTGLANRRALDHVLSRMGAVQRNFSLVQLDLDLFKQVNDTHGHGAGDHVLQEVARRLLSETRDEDTVARVGGDEFTLIFDGLLDQARLSDLASRLIAALEVPITFGTVTCQISASIGIARSCDYSGYRIDQMIEEADRALYASKRAGRAQFAFAHTLSGIEG
ncbi:GGDEF domain-containing protein [Pseudoprimorskyibacter insulae]|nr:GGDEF domain-containing protein [Pseudoprimorskyibacter insulae]